MHSQSKTLNILGTVAVAVGIFVASGGDDVPAAPAAAAAAFAFAL